MNERSGRLWIRIGRVQRAALAAGTAALLAVPLGLALLGPSDGDLVAGAGDAALAGSPGDAGARPEAGHSTGAARRDAAGSWERGAGPGSVSFPDDLSVAELMAALESLRAGERSHARNRQRAEVLRRIGAVGGPDALGALEQLVRDGVDPVERLGAMNVLWERGRSDAAEALARASEDPMLLAKVSALRRARPK